jgi:hypothetical protein
MNGEKEKSLMEQPIDVSAEKELQVAPSTAAAIQEIQASIVVAKKFPRIVDECWAKLMQSCKRQSFAKKASYSYPRGGTQITGPSVNLARTAGQCYGNIRYGVDIVRDDDEDRTIVGWAWDVENNVRASYPDHFKKLIFRKKGGWVVPDERDLRELTNRRGAIALRNALIHIMPRDFIEDAEAMCLKTLKDDIKDPAGEKKRLILAFDEIGVTVEMLTAYVKSDPWSPDDLVELQGIITAIKEGTNKRDDYFRKEQQPPANGTLSEKDMKAGNPEKHQGYEPQEKSEKQKGDGF